jgi:hypothetical protein
LYALLHALTHKANVTPRVRSSNPDIEASLRANSKEGFLFVINHEAASPKTVVSLSGLDFPLARAIDLESTNAVPLGHAERTVTLDVDTSKGITRILHLVPTQP